MEKIDFKKEWPHLYNPSSKGLSEVEVPEMQFLMADGHGVARAGLIVEAGHADLPAEKLDGHGLDPRKGVGARTREPGPDSRAAL